MYQAKQRQLCCSDAQKQMRSQESLAVYGVALEDRYEVFPQNREHPPHLSSCTLQCQQSSHGEAVGSLWSICCCAAT